MPMPDPLTAVGASINATFRLADFWLSVQGAPEEIKVFSELIKRVGLDRTEALEEFKNRRVLLDANPRKKEWTIGIIADTNRVLENIGETVENARIDGVKGKSVSIHHRLEWVFFKKESVLMLQHWLSTCHQSLLSALNYMHGLQPTLNRRSVMLLSMDKDEAEDMLRSPHARRPRKSSSQLLQIEPPTYSDTLAEDLERAFEAVEALVTNEEQTPQLKVPVLEHADIQVVSNDADDGLDLPIPVQPERTFSVDYRRRRREAFLQSDDT